MSSIAQKLCDEICEESPQSRHNSHRKTGENNRKLYQASSSRYVGRPTRSITVEKERTINKVVPPNNSSRSKIVINKFKSKETLLKKTFVDTALNTIITGPLRCDHEAVTAVRRREYKGNCKCGNKPNCRVSAKEIQTFDNNYGQLDKACAHCVETVNCGTQFLERLSSRRMLSPNINSRAKLCTEVNTQTNTEVKKDYETRTRPFLGTQKSKTSNFMGARRWALSQYNTRGPDF